MRTLALGGQVVMMQRFDPELSLKFIEHYQITHSQWVPTMFVRMLKLDSAVRERYNLSSHQCAIHAAAPVGRNQTADDELVGPNTLGVLRRYRTQWHHHHQPGRMAGAARFRQAHSGILHICDENGVEQAQGDEGLIYFEQPTMAFEYHNAPEKTSGATHRFTPIGAPRRCWLRRS